MVVFRKYNAATTVLFPLVDRGTVDFESTPVTFVAADTQISKDEGAFANTGSTPVHEGNGIYSLALTATEMQASRIVVTVIDAATKAWEDQAILIDTYGNASAQHAFDLNSALADTYQAKVWVFDDDGGTNDRYVVVYFKNAEPVTTGITSPTIQVIKASDGTDLVASVALTQIGALGLWKRDEPTNRMVDGAAYIAKIQATIDGATRTWFQPVGRDS